jgi:hypothetical protein
MKGIAGALAIAVTALAGCAAAPSTEPGGFVERQYVTGSNIPKKSRPSEQVSGVTAYDQEAAARALEAALPSMRPKGSGGP